MQKLTSIARTRSDQPSQNTHDMYAKAAQTQYRPQSIPTAPPVPQVTPRSTPTSNRGDELARVFNTVLVTSQSKGKRDFSAELCELTDSAPFKAILSAVRQLSSIHGLTEKQAVEQIISTFRKMDQVWGEYVFREGLEKIKSSK